MLACTSDKSTLHIFDVPHPKRPSRQPQQQPSLLQPQNSGGSGSSTPSARNGTGPSALAAGSEGGGGGKGKWGILAKIPMMPRVFSDVYSFASAPFAADDDDDDLQLHPQRSRDSRGGGGGGNSGTALPVSESTTLGTSRPPKGVIGWVSETTLLVVGAGRDARWEKFVVVNTGGGGQDGGDGRRSVVREGWKRYLPG